MPFHKHSTAESGHGFFTSSIHSPEAFRKGITFIVKYLGSISIPKPKNRFEIIAAMNQARTEFRSNDLKKTKVVIRVGVEGIKVKLWSSKKKHTDSEKIEDDNLPLILHHSMFRIYYVTLDSYDLKIFSYFARDSSSDNRFRCNVFKSLNKSQAMHVVRTIGQAFEVCNKFKDSTSGNHFAAEDDAEADEDDERAVGSRSIGSHNKKLLRTRSRSVNGHDTASVATATTKIVGGNYGDDNDNDNDDSQDSDQSYKDISNDFKNFKMGEKLKTKSKSVEKLSCLSTGNQTYRQNENSSEMFYNSAHYKNANSLNDFLRQNSLPSVTINDDNLVQYKTSNYEWLLINAKLEHEIQETQAAFSQIKLLQNQLQAEKAARLESQNLINHLLGQNRELLAHISTLIQQLNSRSSTDRCSSKDKSRSPRPSDDSEPSPGTNFKYLTLPSKSSSSSSSPLFNHSNSPKFTDTLPKLRKNRSLTRDRTIIEEDFNNGSNTGSITRSFSEKLPQRNLGTLSEAQRIQWARHTTK